MKKLFNENNRDLTAAVAGAGLAIGAYFVAGRVLSDENVGTKMLLQYISSVVAFGVPVLGNMLMKRADRPRTLTEAFVNPETKPAHNDQQKLAL